MNTRSHKIIWTITLTTVVLAFGVHRYFSASEERAEQAQARALRVIEIGAMKTLLETDWRLRRAPTREQVERVANYSTTPEWATQETYFAQGVFLFYAQSDRSGAEASLRRAIELDPQWAWPHDVLGIVLFRSAQQEAGVASIEKAIALAPEWSRPYSDLARLYRLEKQWDKALGYAQIAVDMDKTNPIPLYNYGVILDYRGDRAGAQAVYRRVLKLNAQLPAPYYNIACDYARNGELDEALKHLGVALELNPEFYGESEKDSDFDGLRADPKFIEFMEAHRPNE